MEEMNQGTPAAAPAAAPMDTKPMAPMGGDDKKSSMGMIVILVVVAAVAALLILSKSKDMGGEFPETTGVQMEVTGEVQPIENTSDELDAIDADINSINFDDIDAGLQ